MPSNAERRERFLRVSKKRLKKALDAIESINSLDGDHYKFDNDEIPKIFASLYASLYIDHGICFLARFSLIDRCVNECSSSFHSHRKLMPAYASMVFAWFGHFHVLQDDVSIADDY